MAANSCNEINSKWIYAMSGFGVYQYLTDKITLRNSRNFCIVLVCYVNSIDVDWCLTHLQFYYMVKSNTVTFSRKEMTNATVLVVAGFML
jgi:Gpi18-like mannosyltransferase